MAASRSGVRADCRSCFELMMTILGKDATHHRRPHTSRTPGHSTPNAGRNRKHQRSIPRGRRLLDHRGTTAWARRAVGEGVKGRCRRALHRHRGSPRRRPGLQLLTPVKGLSPLFQLTCGSMSSHLPCCLGDRGRYRRVRNLSGGTYRSPDQTTRSSMVRAESRSRVASFASIPRSDGRITIRLSRRLSVMSRA
jgi:hypothetical protein